MNACERVFVCISAWCSRVCVLVCIYGPACGCIFVCVLVLMLVLVYQNIYVCICLCQLCVCVSCSCILFSAVHAENGRCGTTQLLTWFVLALGCFFGVAVYSRPTSEERIWFLDAMISSRLSQQEYTPTSFDTSPTSPFLFYSLFCDPTSHSSLFFSAQSASCGTCWCRCLPHSDLSSSSWWPFIPPSTHSLCACDSTVLLSWHSASRCVSSPSFVRTRASRRSWWLCSSSSPCRICCRVRSPTPCSFHTYIHTYTQTLSYMHMYFCVYFDITHVLVCMYIPTITHTHTHTHFIYLNFQVHTLTHTYTCKHVLARTLLSHVGSFWVEVCLNSHTFPVTSSRCHIVHTRTNMCVYACIRALVKHIPTYRISMNDSHRQIHTLTHTEG